VLKETPIWETTYKKQKEITSTMLPTRKIIIVIPNPLIPHVREIITRAIST
jgi:hypothetical protein